LGEPPTFLALYKIVEIIVADCGMKAIAANGWATISALDRLMHTANSLAAAGDAARHGTEKTSPPSLPMSLSEAVKIVRSLAERWLDRKSAISP
jgi:hypothetical protein